MSDRIKYNEATGKVEVDADVWDMIVDQVGGQCIADSTEIKKLWKDKASRDAISQHLGISSRSTYHWRIFSGTKNKLILAEIYPECVISLPTITQSTHEFQKSALSTIPKAKLQKIKDYSTHSMQVAVNNLISGRVNNPTTSSVVTISKITGVPFHRFIKSTLPQHTPCEMARIKQTALTEKTNILATVIRELKLTGVGLAKGVGTTPSSVSYWCHGKAPRLDAYVALCKYFNVPFDYFSDWLE